MTGFGRAEISSSLGRFCIEVQSLNRKFLESTIFLPKEFSHLEIEAKKWVANFVARGSISVRVHFHSSNLMQEALPDLNLCKETKKSWQKLARDLGYDAKDIDFSFLMQNVKSLPKSEIQYDLKKVQKTLLEGISNAFKDLNAMRETEGKTLQKDLEKRLLQLEKWTTQIQKKSPKAVQVYRKKLEDRLKEFSKGEIEADERFMKEILIFTEKVDISEEITRFFSHIEQFKSLIQSKAQTVGRRMDFLTQEMVREVNTMGSKSSEVSVTGHVLDMKSEIEKIREQVQNIE